MVMKKDPETKRPRFNRTICVACTMCADICPLGVIELVACGSDNGTRRYPALSDPDLCIGCGSCETECPLGAIC